MRRFATLLIYGLCASTTVLNAQSAIPLHRFTGLDGAGPRASLVQGANGSFYGTTTSGGLSNIDFCGSLGCGTIFSLTTAGALTTLHQFCSETFCTDGAGPATALVKGANGSFYGTTSLGGSNQSGTIFEVTASGAFSVIYNFCNEVQCSDGDEPDAGLVRATNGYLYGTTYGGGSHGGGTVFKVTPTGTLTTIYNFCAQPGCADGSGPSAALTQGTDGNLYGTTQESGTGESGTIYKITAAGVLTTLRNLGPADGQHPVSSLTQGSDGNFYGTVEQGGTNGAGTIFKLTPAGSFTKLYDFCSQTNCADGANPYAGLLHASDGNFYGTTFGGGTSSSGIIFQFTPAGTLKSFYSFCEKSACSSGSGPFAGLIQAANGHLYGTANAGGTSSNGTVFTLPLP